MFTEENSKLISSLYKANKRQEISDILEYMGESGDPIFIYPMLDNYAKYKNSSVGYYFLWNFSRLDSPNLGEHLNHLLESYEIQRDHIPLALFFMAERRFFGDTADNLASIYLENYVEDSFRHDFGPKSLELNCVLAYMYLAGIIEKYESKLRSLLFHESLDEGEKALVVSYLMELDAEKQAAFMIDNYESKIKGKNIENNLARKLLVCHDSEKVRELKNLILSEGQEKAVDILNLGTSSKKDNLPIYNNIRTTTRICILRRQINNKTLLCDKMGFPLFPENELIVRQAQCLSEKRFFMSLCKDLKDIISDIDDRISAHGLTKGRLAGITEDIPESREDAPLGKLFVYLSAKGAGVDYYFYGFWQLEGLIENILSEKEDADFFNKLRHFGIEKLYKDKQWHKVHCYLLGYYMQVLERMNKDFNQFISQDLDI